jgi:hypothetical protein
VRTTENDIEKTEETVLQRVPIQVLSYERGQMNDKDQHGHKT